MQPTDLPPAHAPRTPIVIPERVAQRALSRYTLDVGGCHVSTYSTASHGYAQIGWQEPGAKRSTVTLCHRAAWVATTGEQIHSGMTVDHTCKNRRCVNPDHLRLLSNFENARRTSGRDWPLGECANSHSNSELVKRSGKWKCRLCESQWKRNGRAKQAA